MSAPLSEQHLAEIRAAAVRAVELHPSTTFMAPCESLADAVLDAAMPVLLAEFDRLRRALSEATDMVAEQDSEIGGWSSRLTAAEARVAGLEQQLAAAEEAPLAWAERLDLKSLDNFLISLGQAVEYEPMSGAIGYIHELLASFRAAAVVQGGESL